MKVWVATPSVLLVAGAAVALLMVDPDLWNSARHHRTGTVDVVMHRPPQRHQKSNERARPDSPIVLEPVGRLLPVNVEFAPANEPRAGLLFDVRTGRVL